MRYGCGRSREGAGAVASASGERSGSTHKVAEVQCSRNTTPDPGQPHAADQTCVRAVRSARMQYTLPTLNGKIS